MPTVAQFASLIDVAAGATISVTFAGAIQPGESVAISACYVGTNGPGRCADANGNVFALGATIAGVGWTETTFYYDNHPGGPTVVTVTWPASITNKGIAGWRLSPLPAARIRYAGSTVNTQAAPGAGADAVTTGAMSLATDGIVVATALNIVTGSTMSVGTAFTSDGLIWSNFGIAEDKRVPYGGSQAGLFTTSSGADSFVNGGLAFIDVPIRPILGQVSM